MLSSAQNTIKLKELQGSWYCCNDNSAYYSGDSTVLYSSPVFYDCCDEVVWWMKNGIFRKYDNTCKEKSKNQEASKNYGAKFSIVKSSNKRILVISGNKTVIEKFEVVSVQIVDWPNDAGANYKKLTLVRVGPLIDSMK